MEGEALKTFTHIGKGWRKLTKESLEVVPITNSGTLTTYKETKILFAVVTKEVVTSLVLIPLAM